MLQNPETHTRKLKAIPKVDTILTAYALMYYLQPVNKNILVCLNRKMKAFHVNLKGLRLSPPHLCVAIKPLVSNNLF